MVQLTGDYIMAETEKKQLKTFSLHEKNMKYVAMMKKAVLRYKHVENMLNIILNKESDIIFALPADKRDLNYDKYFSQGNEERNTLVEFNSNNTELMTVEEVLRMVEEKDFDRIVIQNKGGKVLYRGDRNADIPGKFKDARVDHTDLSEDWEVVITLAR